MAPDAELLTTVEIAGLLRVHPKHVYRLLRRGLPARRVGSEWRFSREEVLAWSSAGRSTLGEAPPSPQPVSAMEGAPVTMGGDPPRTAPLVAANGDLVVEVLIQSAGGSPALGLVPADQGSGLDLLQQRAVLAAGSHGPGDVSLGGDRLVFIHLVEREVGLALRRDVKLTKLSGLRRLRIASRPPTAGVRPRFDAELRRVGIDPDPLHARAALLPSHLEVVCAVARGDADVGLASAAWAQRTGLAFRPLFTEAYGLALRAADLGDPRIVRLCEAVQGAAFRARLAGLAGYRTQQTGAILYAS